MDGLTFGRYSPYNTPIHKLDPRNKIFLMILFMVGIFFQFKMWSTSLIMSGCYFLILIVIMVLSRVSFIKLFKSMASMWLMILFLLAIYIFIPTYSHTIEPEAFKMFNSYPVYWDSFCRAGYIILRLIMMLSLTMILTSTTKPMDMTYAFEWYMTPLKVIRFPAHEIAMTLSIALRFIPTLLDETNRIMKAQESRGADFSHGVGKRFRALISLMIPLFVSAIDRSEELANAMEVRGYNPRSKRTRYRVLRFHWKDLFAFILIGSIFAGIIYLFVLDQQTGGLDVIDVLFKVKGF